MLLPGIQIYNTQDPFLFFDRSAQRWRVLVHQYSLSVKQHLVGGAAVSLTPELLGPWELQNHSSPAYTIWVNDTNGALETMSRRERPKLLLGEDGAPEVLYTAVCPANPKGDGLCYSHAQRIGKKDSSSGVI